MIIMQNLRVPHHLGTFFLFRVEEFNWKQWRSDLGFVQEEDPGDSMMKSQPKTQTPGKATDSRYNLNLLVFT